MQPHIAAAAPRRTLIWDEQNARYIFLDESARQAAANLRAKRAADALRESMTSGVYSCALGDIYNPADYDAATSKARAAIAWREKNREKHNEYSRRSRQRREAALAAAQMQESAE